MAALASCSSKFDDERDLAVLLEAFGSVVSLEVIASAYCQAKRDVDKAGEILYEMRRNKSTDTNDASEAELDVPSATWSATKLESVVQKSDYLEITRASKAKKCSVSMGTVSGVIGKDYVRSRPSINEPCKATKPLKLTLKEFPMPEIWSEENSLSLSEGKEIMQEDVEKFLFDMLGDGFQLDKNVIHEVLGFCGYDLKKSMEKLLDLSASTLETSDHTVGRDAAKSTEKYTRLKSRSNQGKMNQVDTSKRDKDRYNLQREVLAALFNAPEGPEEVPKTYPLKKVRSRAFGKVVLEPVPDTTVEHTTVTAELEKNSENDSEDDEDSFQVLRQAVKEHWSTMKEYYKAAVEAFTKGDNPRAYKLLEVGHFFGKKAREADEKSARNLTETNECIKSDVMTLNLLDQDAKEAVRLLRFHLTSLSGIPSIEYLKVIMGPNDENVKRGSPKRSITKLLERESIKWTEEQNGEVLLIRVDGINPNKLSFVKKQ